MRQLTVVAMSALLVLALASGVVAKQHGSDRPIWANLSGEINFYLQTEVEDCPVLTVSDSYGTMSHLGRVWIHWTHCPSMTGGPHTNEHFTITSANGDTLVGVYDVDVDPSPMDITDGTGRFAGATGHLLSTFQIEGEWGPEGPINPWHGWWQMKGSISY